MTKDCEPSTTARYTLEKHLPVGFLWLAFRTVGTLFYKIWGGFARAYDGMTNDLCRMEKELNPYSTKDLLQEWETSFGLPDTCLPGSSDFDTRKAAMLERFQGKRWVTIDDWRELAVLAGVTAIITPGDELLCHQGFPYKFPIVFGGQKKGGRYLIYIEVKECEKQGGFPYKFPIVFGQTGEKCALFKCLIKTITPAFVVVIWDKPPTCDPILKWFEKGFFAKAAFVLDFKNKKAAHYSNELLLGNMLSCARATNGYGERLDGSLELFAPNVPRITNKGLLVEPADNISIALADGIYNITFTFDDDSTEIINGVIVTGGAYAVPDNLSRAYIKSISGELA